MSIAVVDYHAGNLSSVLRGLERAGAEARVTDDPIEIATSDAVVLPGVGSFADAMSYLEKSGEAAAIQDAIEVGVPFLGICLGLQLLFQAGDEGVPGATGDCAGPVRSGLGLFAGRVKRLRSERLKVPHVGWDTLDIVPGAGESPLLEGIPWGASVYFTHSYALEDEVNPRIVLAKTHYGWSFPSVVGVAHVFGTQFHPEKSSAVGERLLRNFCAIVDRARAGEVL